MLRKTERSAKYFLRFAQKIPSSLRKTREEGTIYLARLRLQREAKNQVGFL